MKKLLLAAVFAGLAGSAQADIIPTLDAVTANGDGTYRFDYTGTLAEDQGVRSGDSATRSKVVIFDFAGYVDGSISTGGNANVNAYVELVSDLGAGLPLAGNGESDDASLFNLVFEYIGPDFRTSDGPYPSFDFGGFSAASIFSGVALDGFASRGVKNNGDATGSNVVNFGQVGVPTGTAVPEPGMIGLLGLGLLGLGITRRRRTA